MVKQRENAPSTLENKEVKQLSKLVKTKSTPQTTAVQPVAHEKKSTIARICTDDISKLIQTMKSKYIPSSDPKKTDNYHILPAFFLCLSNTKQNRQLSVTEMLLLKTILSFGFNLNSACEKVIETFEAEHRNLFRALDLVILVPKGASSPALLDAILKNFSKYNQIHDLFFSLTVKEIINKTTALACIHHIGQGEHIRGLLGLIPSDRKNSIDFIEFFQHAENLTQCMHQAETRLVWFDDSKLTEKIPVKRFKEQILLHPKYVLQFTAAIDVYYRKLHNWGNDILHVVDRITGTLKKPQLLEFLEPLMKNYSLLIRDNTPNGEDLFSRILNKHAHQAKEILNALLMLEEFRLLTHDNTKIIAEKFEIFCTMCAFLDSIYQTPWFSENSVQNILNNIATMSLAEAKWLNIILCFYSPGEDEVINDNFVKVVFSNKSIWESLANELNNQPRTENLNDADMLSIIEKLKQSQPQPQTSSIIKLFDSKSDAPSLPSGLGLQPK